MCRIEIAKGEKFTATLAAPASIVVFACPNVAVCGCLGWTGRVDHRGARGQGRAHALALAAEGADIVAADAPGPMSDLTYPLGTEDDLHDTAKLVAELGRRCVPIAVDVRDSAQVDAAVEQTVKDLGRLDIVVANAGIVSTGPLEGVSDRVWQQLVDTNLTGAFHTLRAAIPVMRRQQYGRIVVTSSMGGRMGIPELAAYNATKWG